MDCDDVAVLLAHDPASWSDAAGDGLDAHVATCDACYELVRRQREAPTARSDGGGDTVALPWSVEADRYDVGDAIATGGMGRILRAFDTRLGREVALKEALSSAHHARFAREATITARLQHPAIVPIYEVGTSAEGTPFYAMRLVEGETLTAEIERRTSLVTRLELLPNVIAACEAVAYAHARGVVHRDLKPHNILVGAFGETVVIDWGLAKTSDVETAPEAALPTSPELTSAGTVLGTPCYIAPEQARGEATDERADVFSLGAILYHLLAGTPPYWDQTREGAALFEAVRTRPPTAIAERAPAAPVDLRAIVEHAMAREPAARYRDASAVAAELRRFQAGQLLVSRAYSLKDLVVRWARKHRALVGLTAAATLAVIVVGAIAIRNVVRARAAEREAATAFERGQRKLCAASAPAFASPWTADARDLVRRRFAHVELPFVPETLARVEARLDRWSADLTAAREAACAPGHTSTQLAAELDCLAQRTREGRALLGQFFEADKSTVTNALLAADQLPPIARCTTVPRNVDARAGADVASVRDLFARSFALLELGKAREALPITQEAVAKADAIGDLGLRAAAHVALGAAQSNTGAADAAIPTLQRALRLAENAHDDRSRAQAWTNLVRIEYQRGRNEQAVAMQAAALGACERVGDVFMQTEVMLFVGGALGNLGKLAESEALFLEAVRLRRSTFGGADRRLANALSAVGNAYAMQGNLEAGIAAHREAVTIGITSLGERHPSIGTLRGNLASDYIYALRPQEAIDELEKANAVATAVYGETSRDVATGLTNLGMAQYVGEQHDAAIATFTRAIAGWRAVNAKHPSLAEALTGRYLAQRARGETGTLADLEEALALAKGLPPFIRARVELALGKAVGGARGKQLGEAAVAGFATTTLPLTRRELADAKAWLAGGPH